MNEKTNSNNKKQEVILGTFLTIIGGILWGILRCLWSVSISEQRGNGLLAGADTSGNSRSSASVLLFHQN